MKPSPVSDVVNGRRVVATYRGLAEDIVRAPLRDGLRCRVVAIDGFSGSGKSSFARRLARELDALVVSTDDLLPGWDGLEQSLELLAEWILEPLTRGEVASWCRFDWDEMRYVEWVRIAHTPCLVVEGCGVGHQRLMKYVSELVWVSAPESVRRERLPLRSDWEMYRPFVAMWAEQERLLRENDDPMTRADVVVDSGGEESGTYSETIDLETEFLARFKHPRRR